MKIAYAFLEYYTECGKVKRVMSFSFFASKAKPVQPDPV